MKCSAATGTTLVSENGFPRTIKTYCAQTVGVTRVLDLSGLDYGYCRFHKDAVLATVRRADNIIRSAHEVRWSSTFEELRSIRREFGNREIA
jgi:hypothetical protein